MKKIMKKALSLMLALVMVFSLAPMTAKAATDAGNLNLDGSTVNTVTYTESIDWVNDNRYYYTWTAEESGSLKITATTDDLWIQCFDASYQGGEIQDASVGDVNTISVSGGTTYTVWVMTWSETAGTVGFTAELVKGEQSSEPTGASPEDAIPLEGAQGYITAAADGYTFYKATIEARTEYTLTMQNMLGASYEVYTYSNNNLPPMSFVAASEYGAVTASVGANATEIILAVLNTGVDPINLSYSLMKAGAGENPSEPVVGTQENPDVITELGNKTGDCTSLPYWCQWTAEGTGLFTVTVDAEEPTFGIYTVNDAWEYNAQSTDTAVSVEVAEGDVVLFYVRDFANTTVDFTTSFEAGATLPEDDEDDDDLGGETEVNFEMSDTAIEVGDNVLPGPSNFAYTYTVHEFAPGEIGKYTFTTSDAYIGIVSTHGMWINVGNPGEEPNTEMVPALVVVEDEIVWECTHADQSIWVAVMPFGNSANVNVTREDLVVEEIPVYNRYASISLEPYVFDGNLADLDRILYVDIENTLPIMDEDGYYHLVPTADYDEENDSTVKDLEDYPLILFKLNDSVLSLEAAIGYGKIAYTEYDGNDDPVYILNYNPMIEQYLLCADTTDKLYPLTDDLLELVIEVGNQQGWYEEDGAVAPEFANDGVEDMMLPYFAAYYLDQDITTLDKEEPVVEKDDMTAIIENNKDKDTVINTVVTNAAGEEVEVKFTFEANTMKPVDGVEEYSFKVELVENYDKATADKAEIEKDEFVIRINFEHEGKLPAKATISIPVGAAYADKTLYYYQILADGTLKYVCDAPVDGAGNAKVTQDHCSDYVLLSEKIVEDTVPPGGTGTGDSTNFALWIAVLGFGIAAIAGSVVMRKREF